MSISFRNIPHALATFFKAAAADIAKLSPVVEKIEGEKTEIEAVSGAVAAGVAGPAAAGATITIEDAAFSVLGAVDAALKAGGDAAAQNLLDAGLDATAIAAAKAVGTASASVYTTVKSAAK